MANQNRRDDPAKRYEDFQARLEGDIANVRALADWAIRAAEYVPNTNTIRMRAAHALAFCDGLSTILMLRIASDEDIANSKENQT